MTLLNGNPIKLCTRRSCCPTVTYNQDTKLFLIEDDYDEKDHCTLESIRKIFDDCKDQNQNSLISWITDDSTTIQIQKNELDILERYVNEAF